MGCAPRDLSIQKSPNRYHFSTCKRSRILLTAPILMGFDLQTVSVLQSRYRAPVPFSGANVVHLLYQVFLRCARDPSSRTWFGIANTVNILGLAMLTRERYQERPRF